MKYPTFFDTLPTITMFDPLSSMLGAIEDGLITYSYLDAVKLAGHSCPTVAGAYLMAYKALKELYPNEYPVRGEIEVRMQSSKVKEQTGVVANVISLITGAADEGGFKGIQTQFSRNSLLSFEADITSTISFKRKDYHKEVYVNYNPSILNLNAIEPHLMKKLLTKSASKEEQESFHKSWQSNVEKIFKNSDNAELVTIKSNFLN